MTDHPIFIPTSEGPVGGIVSEPPGEPRAALLLLPAYGRPARSGINSFWTRVARGLAERGLLVVRADYSREGETLPVGEGVSGQVAKNALDLLLFGQALPWIRERLGGLDLHVAGSCSGARGAIELAGRNPAAIARTFLVVPHLRVHEGVDCPAPPGANGLDLADPRSVDPALVERMRVILDNGPSWILVGEHDTTDIPRLQRLIGPTAHDLEVEIVPDVALHFLDQPDLQEETQRQLVARISRALDERELAARA